MGAANSNNELIWWRNVKGDGQTWERKSVDAFQAAKRVCVTDLDQDGDMDILATADKINQGIGDIAWWENVDDGDDPGNGESWLKHMVEDDFEYPNFVQAVDMDRDGDLDVLANAYFAVAWWENGGDPAASWQKHEVGGYFEYAQKARPADMDGDIDIDIVVSVNREGIVWLENKSAPLTVEIPASAIEGNSLVNRGTVSVSEAPVADVTVLLASDDESEVAVPATVTIEEGNTSADFDVYAQIDGILDGTQTATVTASAEGCYSPGSDSIEIYDAQTAVLTVEIPENATEGDGTLATQGTVSAGASVDEDVVVALACDDETELRVPDTATILSGESSAQFELVVVDEEEFDGQKTARVTASVPGWTDGTDTMEVADDETYDLLLSGPETAMENDGTLTAAMDVSITGILDVPLVVDLYSDAPSVATVPDTVTILAGQFHRKFDLTLIDDSVYGGPTTVNIEASAEGGWVPADLDIDVTDDETYPVVEFQSASSEGDESVENLEFAVTLTPGCLRTATVNYAVTESTATGGGVDYTLIDGQLTFDPGETSATIYATVADDEDDDDDEYFTVTLSGPTEANLGTNPAHTYTIIDNDRIPVTLTVCASGCQHTSIQAAIDEALEEDTVLVSPGTYAETIDFGGKPITVKSVEGPNQTTIDGGCAGSVVRFDSGETATSILEGFAIENGCADYGGGIFLDGASPQIKQCHVVKNKAAVGGGGMFASNGSSPAISECLVAENRADGYGGGLACESSSSPEFSDGLIAGNYTGNQGGGVYANASSLVLTRTEIAENNAMQNGGGLLFTNSAAPLVSRSRLMDNAACGSGGGAHVSDGAAPEFVNVMAVGNSATYDGGAFYASGAATQLSVVNATVSENAASFGGGVFAEDAAVLIGNSIFWNDEREIDLSGTASVTVEYSDVQTAGGAYPGTGNINEDPLFVSSGSDWRLQSGSSCIDAADASSAPIDDFDGQERPFGAGADMGADEWNDSVPTPEFSASPVEGYATLSVAFTDLSGPEAQIASRSWDFGDGTTSTDENPVHVYETAGTYRPRLTVTDADGDSDSFLLPDPVCVADPGPKAFFIAFNEADSGPLDFEFRDVSSSYAPITSWTWDFGDSSPVSNTFWPVHQYAAAGEYEVTLTVTSEYGEDSATRFVTVHEGSAETTLTVCAGGTCDHETIQGAIDAASDGDTILVKAGTYFENIAFKGKAVRVVSESDWNDTIIDGGGVGSVASFVDGEGLGSVLEGFKLQNGSALFGGGVYCDSSSSPLLRKCCIQNCVASTGGGGVAALNSSRPTLFSCWISDNQADFGGGVACLRSSLPAFQYAYIFLNQATGNGGGFFAYDDSALAFGNWLTLDANRAGGMGGGLFARLCSIHAKVFIMEENQARNGAAAAFDQVISAVLERCALMESAATGNGGAMYGLDSSLLELRNCLVAANSAAFGGGASFDNVALLSAINCTIADNEATEDGPGVFGTKVKGGLKVINTILRNGGDEIVLTDSGPIAVEYSNVQQDSGTYPGTGNINLDPLFVYAPNDYRLSSGSPCRNTGTSDGAPIDDLDGKQRPQGTGYDMGCYEADNLAPVIEQSDPLTASMDEDGAPVAWESPALSATDGDADVLEWSVSSNASNGTATVNGSGPSPTTFEYQPDDNYNGPDSFEIQVSDNQGGTDTITVNVTVDPVNDPPTIEGEPEMSVDAYSPYEFVPSADDPDLEGGDTLSFEIANKPSWADFSTETGALTGTPDNSDCGTCEDIQISVRDLEGETATLDAFDLTVNMAPGQPSAKTGPAESPDSTKATLTGEVNPNGGDTQYYFEYWIDPSDKKTTDTATEPASVGDVSVFATAYRLDPATGYTFRLVARNDADEAFGEEMTFDSAPMTSETVYVDPQARCGDHVPCFAEISNAMDNALQGSTILVGASTYYENLTIEPGMTVQLGQNCDFSGTVPVEPVIIVGESQ